MEIAKTGMIVAVVVALLSLAFMVSQAGASPANIGEKNEITQAAQTLPAQNNIAQAQPAQENIQDVYIKALPSGSYDKTQVQVKAGTPVRFHFTADKNAGCGKMLLINEFGVRLTSTNGEESVAQFTPSAPGTYQYHCGMYMFVGKLVVV